MNKDKKAAAGQQQPPPPPTAGTPANTAATAALPKLATPMEEVPAVLPMAAKVEEAGGLSPTLRPPAGSFSGGSLDGGDSDSEEHLQVWMESLEAFKLSTFCQDSSSRHCAPAQVVHSAPVGP
jgi:hypothetical protein